MSARVVAIRTERASRPDPTPTGATVNFDRLVAARLETIGAGVTAVGRGLRLQTTDSYVASAKTRLAVLIAELTGHLGSM